MLLFTSATSFLIVDDDKKKQEEEEVVLATRLLDVVEDEVRCPEAPAGAFNISFFFLNARERKERNEEEFNSHTDISKVYLSREIAILNVTLWASHAPKGSRAGRALSSRRELDICALNFLTPVFHESCQDVERRRQKICDDIMPT